MTQNKTLSDWASCFVELIITICPVCVEGRNKGNNPKPL
nr:MAG TPA: hypothetical protein [Caudoviricetes sp.]